MSKLMLFDLECPDHGVFEELIPAEAAACPCPKCGKESPRIISAVRIDWRAMGVSSDFPTCADKWDKMQREKSRKEESSNLVMY
jgi:hypothetical protein